MKRAIRLILVMVLIGAGYLYLGPLASPFQGKWMLIFIAVSLVLVGLNLLSNQIEDYLRRRFRTFISPIFEENHRVSLVLSNRFEATEKALDGFTGAIHLYARHLASHTSAIQGLSEASQALKGSAAEQNRILSQLTNAFTQQRSQEEISKMQRVVYDIEKRTRERLQAREALEKEVPALKREPHVEPPKEKVQSPSGCVVNPKALLARRHYSFN